jgi:hypothetical protein
VLLGIKASAAASKNWPSVVQASYLRFLKRKSKKDGNRRRYRRKDSGCESDGDDESDE